METLTEHKFWPLIIVMLTVGCGHGDHEHHHGSDAHQAATTSPIAEGCKHLEFGPFDRVDLTAGIDARDQIHTAYTISLGGDEGAHSGTFEFTSPGGTHYVLMDKAVTIEVQNTSGDPIHGMDESTEDCAAAASVTEFSFETGATYTIAIGPTEHESVNLAIHVAGASHDHVASGDTDAAHDDDQGEHTDDEHTDEQTADADHDSQAPDDEPLEHDDDG